MRDSMIFYRSFFEAIQGLPVGEQSKIYNAIFSYGLNFTEPELDGISKAVWILIKPQIDANIKRFENGKKPKQKSKTKANEKQKESKSKANNNNNVNVNENENEKSKINFDSLLVHFNDTFKKRCFVFSDKVKKQYLARINEGYNLDQIKLAMINASKDEFHKSSAFKHCTLEFFSRPEKIDKFAFTTEKRNINQYIPTK